MALNLKYITSFNSLYAKRFFSASPTAFNCGIKNVAVIGGGIMGSGIAQVVAQNNYKVTVWDVNDKSLDKTRKVISSSLQRVAKKTFKDDAAAVEKYIHDVNSRISYVTKTEEAVSEVDLIIEAIVEDLRVKQNLFKQLDSMADEKTIFATNTSSILVTAIAEAVADQRKNRFFGLHFFNPVPVMKLVEIITIPESDPVLLEKVTTWVKDIGKTAVHCKDIPGFVVNQLLVPYIMNAIVLAEKGDASPRDIDVAMKLGAGVPMGPLELADYVGLDIVKRVAESLNAKKEYNPMFVQVPKILDRLVAENKLGVKSGEGFFKYN